MCTFLQILDANAPEERCEFFMRVQYSAFDSDGETKVLQTKRTEIHLELIIIK
jgi:hypothetical protein